MDGWMDGGMGLRLRQSGCTARGGMRRAPRAPPESSRDPDHVSKPPLASGGILLLVPAPSSDARGVKRRAPTQFL